MSLPIKGLLLDITGVLYEAGEGNGTVIEGSVEAVKSLKSAGIPFRLVTNESCLGREQLLERLLFHKFPVIAEEIFSPVPAAISLLREKNLTPHLLVDKKVRREFDEFGFSNPTCVVVGDANHDFTFENMNAAFHVLMSLKEPLLISMGKGKYYKEKDKLMLDLGPFVAALEFACDIQATIVGKPSPEFFAAALKDMGIEASEAIMVGDDINSDVGGAQRCGLRGILVKTGKFTPANLDHPSVTPDFVANNLAHAVDNYILSK